MAIETAVYLDSNVFIYAMESAEIEGDLARRWLSGFDTGKLIAVTSELTLAEVLPRPIAAGETELVAGYRRLLEELAILRLVPVRTDILLGAAELRAATKISLPDAIHVATATLTRCCGILTNDVRLQAPPSMPRFALADAPGSVR